jgi:aerobic carbon-monoxide dehydrogenase large subunit
MAGPVLVPPRPEVRRGRLGEPLPRREDEVLLTGRARYVDNLDVPGSLHARVIRSPFPHARVASVDVSAALALPGVVAAFSGAELRQEWAAPLPMIWAITPDTLVPDHWPLTPDVARHEGDGVAVVVAESPAVAEDAAELVEVDYDPLPAVVDVEAALAEGAPLVHEGLGGNRCYELAYEQGEVKEAFAGAAVVVSRRLVQQRVLATALETRATLALPDTATGDHVLYTSTQIPHIVRRTLAPCLGIPEHRLRVVAPDVGGAFGGKLNVYAEEALVLALARRLGRPVKWVEGRAESCVATTHGRAQLQRLELAADEDGRLRGVRASLLVSMGAYLQLETPGVPILGQVLFGGAYRADAYRFDCTGVFTNQTPLGAYRGVGRAEAAYAIERGMDALARELDLDPVALRRRNLLPAGVMVENAARIPYDSVDFEGALDAAVEEAGYEELRVEQARLAEEGGPVRLGIGVSVHVDSSGAGPSALLGLMRYEGGGWESARVRVLPSGTVEVATGNSPQGQGHVTAYSQIVAEVLGVPLESVGVSGGDTAATPPGIGTFSSRSMSVGGTAVHRSATKALEKARAIAAHLLGAEPDEVELAGGSFVAGGDPGRSVAFADVARVAWSGHDLPVGMEPGLDELTVHDPPGFTHSFGAHVAVVEVDVETCHARVVRYVAVDDYGRVVNPLLADGQLRGGLAQGIAQALYEEAVYSEDGQLLNGSLLGYLVPSAAELPRFELHRRETPSPTNPLGVKGVAEAGTIGGPPAVMIAVLDALAPLGVRELDMPATPERIWTALREAGAAAPA